MKEGRYVVDGSVAIKLFIDEPFSEQAEVLFSILKDDPAGEFYVPDLFFIECTNVLWKHIKRFGYPEEKAYEDLAALRGLSLQSFVTGELVADALMIAVAHDITAYDACYLALGQQLKIPLVTADERLSKKMADTVHVVQWLADFLF
jgi:predicted nucleic acid-binding protein